MIVPVIDCRSEQNIQTLNPKVQPIFREFLCNLKEHFMEKAIEATIICGTRSNAQQNALYAKGRTEPGPRITNARGGYSNHNFGIAVDIGLFKNERYLVNSPYYKEIGLIVARHPQLEWGGNWKTFVDQAHVQYRIPYSLAELRERVATNRAIV